MARGDKGFRKMQDRVARDEDKKDALMRKGERAGRPGSPKLTRKEVRLARRMQANDD